MQFTEAPAAGGRVESLEEIDTALAKDIEEAYAYFSDEKWSGRKLDTEAFLPSEDPPMTAKDVAADWLRQARAYCRLRPEGRIVISGSPVKATAEIPGDAPNTVVQVPAYKVRFVLVDWVEGGDNGH